MSYASVNFSVMDEKKAKVSIFDRGILYGEGVFETLLATDGKIFRLEEHVKRLLKSAKIIGLECKLETRKIESEVKSVFSANSFRNAKINIFLTGGEGKFGEKCESPTIMITSKNFSGFPLKVYEKGVRVILVEAKRGFPSAKSTNCLPNIVAYKKARAKGGFEAILTCDGFALEGTTSNLFIVKNRKLITPREKILKGITRGEVLKIAKKLYKVEEHSISIKELFCADEIFITSTLKKVMPVVKVNKKRIGNGRPGPVTNNIMRWYNKILKQST